MTTKIELESTKRETKKANDAEYLFVVESARGANIRNVDNDTIAIDGDLSNYVIKATSSGVLITSKTDKQFKVSVTLQKANEKKGIDAGQLKLVFANGSLDLVRDGKTIKLEDGTVVSRKAKDAAAADLSSKLDASENFDGVTAEAPVDPQPQPGQTFVLTSNADDFFVGTANNDTVIATSATLQNGDIIIDENANDNDVIKLTATEAVVAAGTVRGFEKLEVNWDAFADASVNVQGFAGLKEVSVSTAKLGNLGNLTVTNTGAVNVVAAAGITNNLTVQGVTTGNVDAGLAKVVAVTAAGAAGVESTTVTAGAETTSITATNFDAATLVAGAKTTVLSTNATAATVNATNAAKDAVITLNASGTADSAVVTLGNDATVNSSLAGAEKLTLDVAAGKVVTLATVATSADTVEVKGAGAVTIKGTAANLTTDTITKSNAGLLSVEFTDASVTAVNTASIAADSFKLTAGAAQITAKSGQAFEVAAASAASTVQVGVATDGTADALSLKLTSARYAAITQGAHDVETLTIEAAAAQVTGADLTIDSINAGADNTVVLKGTNDVVVSAVAAAKSIDASALNGALSVGTGTALTGGAINGATGVNTVAFGTIAAGSAATFVGQGGNDVVTLTATSVAGGGAAAGQATFVLGAGNDRVTATSAIAGVLSIQAGEGDDVVALAGNNTGTIVLEFGSGVDTLSLANGASLANAASVVLTGLEVIKIDTGATVAASQVSGQSYVVQGTTNGYNGNTLSVVGTSAADTIDVSKLVASDSATIGAKLSINGGAGADTILLGASTETVVVNVTSAVGAYTTQSSTTAYDKISGFTLGTDKLSISDTDGTAEVFSVVTTPVAAASSGVSAVVSDKGVVTFAKDGVALAAGSAEIDTLAEIIALIDGTLAVGKVVGFAFNGNTYVFGENSAADVLVELTGVTGVTDLTGLLA